MLGQVIKIGAALDRLRSSKVPFSLQFVTSDISRKKASKIKYVQNCRVFKSANVNFDNDMLDFFDVDSKKNFRVFIYLITHFNEIAIVI
jgi:hypothetical protein